MATQKPGGGWDLTDADVDAIAAASGFDVEREQVADNPDPADHQDSPDSGLIDWAARAVETAPPEARSDKDPAYHTGRVDFSELLHTDATEGQAPGANATEDWESTLEVLSEAGLISGDGDVETYFDDAFTPGK